MMTRMLGFFFVSAVLLAASLTRHSFIPRHGPTATRRQEEASGRRGARHREPHENQSRREQEGEQHAGNPGRPGCPQRAPHPNILFHRAHPGRRVLVIATRAPARRAFRSLRSGRGHDIHDVVALETGAVVDAGAVEIIDAADDR